MGQIYSVLFFQQTFCYKKMQLIPKKIIIYHFGSIKIATKTIIKE